MKNNTQQLAIAFLVLSLAINVSQAFQTKPFSDFTAIDRFLNTTQQWLTTHQARFHHDQTHLLISPPVLVAGVLSFIAASLSSAGGIGGGGLYIPILTIVAGADLKTASSLSAFMVTGGSVANVFSSFCSKKSKSGGKNLINFDIALLTQPCMLLGVSIGVICNLAFPEWVITILFAIFLAWSTLKTCKSGMLYWKLETQVLRSNGCEKLEDGTGDEHGAKALDDPLIDTQENRKLRLPLMKLGVLILVWFSFYLIYLLRGNRYGRSLIPIETCGTAYWILSSLQVPVAIGFTLWILHKQNSPQPENSPQKELEEERPAVEPSKKLIFPLMALLAGILGGMFGIGGGMLISPFLLQVGIVPEVTAATCSFMVFFSATMSACQYLLLGMEHAEVAVGFALICFVASMLGLVVVQKAIRDYGRASLIIFSVSIVMALSTVLMTTFGALNVLRDYTAGNPMGFKSPC
ncbi:sulfite exporter TauE/SafE family protein 5-like [Momordica charantia]|uniref:Sulfite exporter TauE/SafE family protein 5-like n=1 Tax=Momordica charantia TaxID=3673 RepID=A0A6J1CDD9_MOMCH|nr:sulfite exporter TauE/SafE family protein 5-like [Momordica charantia]